MKVHSGRPDPLGATWDGDGVNFAVFSQHATGVELCLFERADAARESVRIPMVGRTDSVWHARVTGIAPGQCYGYRVQGPFDPASGHWFNPAKVVLDPYVRALARVPRIEAAMFGTRPGASGRDLEPETTDNAGLCALGAVVDTRFDWGDDRLLRTPWDRTVIYEAHVKGLTMRHTGVATAARGRFLGVASDAVIDHLRGLGVTAIQLMPVHQHALDPHLARLGLPNYWGYSTLGYFAPDRRYAVSEDPQEAVREFKRMVRTLHSAGIEVLLDVVYNHTAEGDQDGTTLSLRGLDHASYYRLVPGERRRCENWTGCGNTLDLHQPYAFKLVMDSLRYWVEEMHVDGFRFDLAPVLGRDDHRFDPCSGFLRAVLQDPVLSGVKLIAEPWDLGPDGYQIGGFPAPWSEWNGKFRDGVRAFWCGDDGSTRELLVRMSGSRDLYQPRGHPYVSVNLVTTHDGFTLHDLVRYREKHNEANLERNQDGENHNLSCNHGVEGESTDPEVELRRRRHERALLAMLFVSRGVPMLSGGDELGRTQRGNNNAYCQDNERSWHDWELDLPRRQLLQFVRGLAQIRAEHALLRQDRFLDQDAAAQWLDVEGRPVDPAVVRPWDPRWLAVRMAGDGAALVLFCNGTSDTVTFRLRKELGSRWRIRLDTARDDDAVTTEPIDDLVTVAAGSVVLVAGSVE